MRHIVIKDIPVSASPSLSRAEMTQLWQEISQAWTWEGRQLGRIELIRDGQWVHVCSYEKPAIQTVPLLNHIKE